MARDYLSDQIVDDEVNVHQLLDQIVDQIMRIKNQDNVNSVDGNANQELIIMGQVEDQNLGPDREKNIGPNVDQEV